MHQHARIRTRCRALAASALASVALAGLTACGGGPDGPGTGRSGTSDGKPAATPSAPPEAPAEPFAELSGPEIHERAYEATKRAESLRIAGRVRSDGKEMEMDIALNLKGECEGTVVLGGGGRAEIVKSTAYLYYKADEALYRSQSKNMPRRQVDAVVASLADRWLKMRADSPEARQSAGMCDLGKLLGSFGSSSPVARKGRLSQVGGQEAMTVTAPSADGGTETYYVATDGKPYLLRAAKTGGTEPGDVTFSEYDRPVDVSPPADKDVVDADKLRGAGRTA
jgi:hypothetical protein